MAVNLYHKVYIYLIIYIYLNKIYEIKIKKD